MDRQQKEALLKIPGVAELAEISYRRGYAQGAFWGVEAAAEQQPLVELRQWHRDLESWRYDGIEKERAAVLRGKKRWSCPPEPWLYAKKKGKR